MLTPDLLLTGYAQGIFPMAASADDPELYWFNPSERGVLPIGQIHASHNLRRVLRRCTWEVVLNRDLPGVIAGCANRPETWINAPLTDLYHELHRRGHAHSIELWDGTDLVGGVFGVTLGAAFFGESMFSRAENASKLALVWLSSHLKRCGFTLFDTQYTTAHLTSMGGHAISRAEYRRQLEQALSQHADFMAHPLPSAAQLSQEITQTSYRG